MEECRTDKNLANFYKIKGFKNGNYQKMSANPIFLQENHF